jgi:tol-pal system protein YbgF
MVSERAKPAINNRRLSGGPLGSVEPGVAVLVLLASLLPGCATLDDRDQLRAQIKDIREMSTKNEAKAAELATQMDEQLKRLRSIVDEATKVVTRNSADVGGKVDKLVVDLAQVTGRIDDIQHTVDALTKQFQDYRAASDTKLEQLTNTMTQAKNPPVPETPEAVIAEGDKRLAANQFSDARRLYEAFVNRYPTDPHAPRAQFQIGEAYLAEKRYANAIGAFTKVIDNFPKSENVPDAMFKNGVAFYALKYCSDAKVYFQELLKRYPKTNWKKEANEQLKDLAKDAKNKNACTS